MVGQITLGRFVTATVTIGLFEHRPNGEVFATVSALSELLKNNRYGIEARQAADKAADLGVHLKQGTIAGYFAGTNKSRPSEKTMKALSEVLSIPLEKIREAAGVPVGESDPYIPPPEANRLSSNQRQAIDQLIKAIVKPVFEVQAITSGEGTASATVRVVGDSNEDQEQEPRTQEGSTKHGGTSRSTRRPGAPISADPSDKDDALIDEDQGSQNDQELAARKGETEDEIRERLGIPYD